jgi:lipopolysaccharide heptosyltransferase III
VNIVLCRLDRIGDLILSTPAIASVRRSWPDAYISIVCSRYNAVVVERNPDVDALVVAPVGRGIAEIGKKFRGRCDLAIALAPCAPDFMLVGATRAPRRVGYTYVRRYVTRLTARLFLNQVAISEADPEVCERRPGVEVRHEVDQVLGLVTLAGGRELVRDLVVPIDEIDRHAVDHVPAGGIAFHLGRRWFEGGSSFENTLALLAELRRFGLPIVVTYGIDVIEEARRLSAAGRADALVGGLSFQQWAAVFEKSRIVVTVDTSATHLASAVRRPTVVLFEHRYFHLSSQEWAPYRVPSVCLRKPAGESPQELAASRAEVVAATESLLGLPDVANT